MGGKSVILGTIMWLVFFYRISRYTSRQRLTGYNWSTVDRERRLSARIIIVVVVVTAAVVTHQTAEYNQNRDFFLIVNIFHCTLSSSSNVLMNNSMRGITLGWSFLLPTGSFCSWYLCHKKLILYNFQILQPKITNFMI